MNMIDVPVVELVLLIDDNETDNFVHKRIIELSGFAREVIVKDSVRKALEYFEQLRGSDTSLLPDIIFLDINMPAADGFVFLSKIEDVFPQQLNGKCRIVVLSSSESTKDISRMVGNKFVTEYLNKPLSEEALARIKASLNK